MTTTKEWHGRFDVDPGFLNTASIGVPPLETVETMHALLDRWSRGRVQPQEFDESVVRARTAFASIAGVDTSTVAAGATASSLAGLVASALEPGDHVLLAEGDFTSVVFPFLAQERRRVRVTEVPLEQIVDAVDEAVDLVAVSAVQSADGRRADVGELRRVTDLHDARLLLDTTQATGWLPLDLQDVDYVVCAAYKWLLCPRGVAFMAVRPDRLDALTPHFANWYAGEDIWSSIYGSPLRLATDARRLDTSPAWFSWAGAVPALELLASLDAEDVRRHDIGLADRFLAGLGQPSQGSAIVTVDRPDAGPKLAAAGITTAVRAGRIRASFHLYNSEDDVIRALDALV